MDVVKYSRPKTLGDLIALEFDANFCRENVTLLAGSGSIRTIPQFTVVARQTGTTQTVGAAAAIGTNVGNGVFGTPTALAAAPDGDYVVTIVEAVTNAGRLVVYKPDGTEDGHGNVAAAYSGSISFTLADGSTDFVAGDSFKVNVSYAAVGKWAALDFTAVNGLQNAAGIAIADATAQDGVDDTVTILRRGPVVVRSEQLIWPVGATATQQLAAKQILEARAIVVRISG